MHEACGIHHAQCAHLGFKAENLRIPPSQSRLRARSGGKFQWTRKGAPGLRRRAPCPEGRGLGCAASSFLYLRPVGNKGVDPYHGPYVSSCIPKNNPSVRLLVSLLSNHDRIQRGSAVRSLWVLLLLELLLLSFYVAAIVTPRPFLRLQPLLLLLLLLLLLFYQLFVLVISHVNKNA